MTAAALVVVAACALGAATPPAAAAPPERRRVLVLDARGAALDEEQRKALTQLVAARLAVRPALDVVAGSDLRALVGLAQDKQLAGCDSDSCLAELAGALDAGLVVTIDANRLGEVTVVALGLFDAKRATTVARRTVELHDLSNAVEAVDAAVDTMADPIAHGEEGGGPPGSTAPAWQVTHRKLTLGLLVGAPSGGRLVVPVGPVDVVAEAGVAPTYLLRELELDAGGPRTSLAAFTVVPAASLDVVVPLLVAGAEEGFAVEALVGLGALVNVGGFAVIEANAASGSPAVPLLLGVRAPLAVRFSYGRIPVDLTLEASPGVPMAPFFGFTLEPALAVSYRF